MNPLARTLAVALAALLCTAPAGLAAEGGPSNNIPVPAGAGGTSAPTTVTAASTPTVPATTAPQTSGGFTITSAREPAPKAAQRPATHPAASSSGTSTTAIVLAAVGALLVLVCGAWAVVRTRGIEPHWTLAFRHAMAEAAHRTAATASELGDWMRLGH